MQILDATVTLKSTLKEDSGGAGAAEGEYPDLWNSNRQKQSSSIRRPPYGGAPHSHMGDHVPLVLRLVHGGRPVRSVPSAPKNGSIIYKKYSHMQPTAQTVVYR